MSAKVAGNLVMIDGTGVYATDSGAAAVMVPKVFTATAASDGTCTVDYSQGNICVLTVVSNNTLVPTFTNLPTNQFVGLVINTVGFNLRSVTWPANTRFNVADSVQDGTTFGTKNGTSINAYKYATTYWSDGSLLWATPDGGFIQTVLAAHVNATDFGCYQQDNIGQPGVFTFLFGGVLNLNQSSRITGDGDIGLRRLSAGCWEVYTGESGASAAANMRDLKARHLLAGGTPPVIASGFGTSPTIAGCDDAFRVTVGTGGVATTGVITFGTAYANAPVCVAANETTGAILQLTPTTTNVTITAPVAWGAGDKIAVLCRGY